MAAACQAHVDVQHDVGYLLQWFSGKHQSILAIPYPVYTREQSMVSQSIAALLPLTPS